MSDDATDRFLGYLRRSLEEVALCFVGDHWLRCQTDIRILTSFIGAAANAFPDAKGRELFKDPATPGRDPRPIWEFGARKLTGVAAEIRDRKRRGAGDGSLCGRVRSTVRGMLNAFPDRWPGWCPDVPEEVVKILDCGGRKPV